MEKLKIGQNKKWTKLKKWTKIIVEETEKLVKIDKIDRLNRGNCKIGKKI